MRKHLTGGSMIALLAGSLSAAPVVSQDTEDFSLEEIIVTAQKREQNLQDVPFAVSAVAGDAVADIMRGGGDIRSLASRIPSFNAESSNGRVAPRFYIRGLGNTDFDLNASQPVSVIIDDVVLENVTLKSFPLFDLENVEVLRGPQGTLFGKNTPAGIVKFRTANPSQETDLNATVSYGTRGELNATVAAGGAISETLSFRVAGFHSGRSDYIDNDYLGIDDYLGGHNELAGRVKVLYEKDNFDALFTAQARDLNGTSALFRANIVSPGGVINDNFDRDTVSFNEGKRNQQAYKGKILSLNMNYEMDSAILTSVTSHATSRGFSSGDIDGGNPDGPGIIFFQLETTDGLEKNEQFTQELRLASNGAENFNWQVGFYYFDANLTVSTRAWEFPPNLVFYTNESWALFGQTEFKLADATTVTLGLRYTDDQKTMTNALIPDQELSGSALSWDAAINHELNDQVNVYARAARGFRAPAIHGRDIAFNGTFSSVDEETIDSFEAGFKGLFMDDRMRLNANVFYWTMNDQQIVAVGGAENSIRLINAEKTKGYGFEAEVEWLVSENLTLLSGLSYNHTSIKDEILRVGACAQCIVDDPNYAGLVNITGNTLPNAPDWLFNISAIYTVPVGEGEFYAQTDWFIEGKKHFFLYNSDHYKASGDFEGGAKIGYRWEDNRYEVFAYARNITNEVNLKGGIDFNNNTGFVNEPRSFGVGFGLDF